MNHPAALAQLVAQVAIGGSILHWIILIIVVAGIVGVMYVVLRQMGVTIPPFLVQIFWIIVAVVVGVLAVKFLWSIM